MSQTTRSLSMPNTAPIVQFAHPAPPSTHAHVKGRKSKKTTGDEYTEAFFPLKAKPKYVKQAALLKTTSIVRGKTMTMGFFPLLADDWLQLSTKCPVDFSFCGYG